MNLAHDLSSERILDLLTELSMDPFAQEALARDPSATLARAGLSEVALSPPVVTDPTLER